MAIPLPRLDDRAYADLVEEARALIPSLAPAWTDHNASDPGFTLVELFAWLTEMLVWRADQVPDASVRAFLRLLNGPGAPESADLAADVRAAVLALRARDRAVTPADYEALCTGEFNAWLARQQAVDAAGGDPGEWWQVSRMAPGTQNRPRDAAPVARARCVPRRYLGAGTEAERTADRPGRLSVLIVPARGGPRPAPLSGAAPPVASYATRQGAWGFLEERRLIATRVSVMSPVYVPVAVEAVIARRADVPDPASAAALAAAWDAAPPADLRRAVVDAVARWLDPLEGGDGGGWPFGRDVHLSELYAVLEAVPGVDHVADLRLSSPCDGGDPGCVSAAPAWHDDGEQVGLALADHHLPRAALDAAAFWFAPTLVPVRVSVSLTPLPGAEPAEVRRAVRDAVRRRLHPATGGPDGVRSVAVAAATLVADVRALEGVNAKRAVAVKLDADPARLLHPADPKRQAVQFAPREMAEWTVEIADANGRAL